MNPDDIGRNSQLADAALTGRFLVSPATAGIVFDGDVGQLTQSAFLENFDNGVPMVKKVHR